MTKRDRDMPNVGRGRSVADACKDARVLRKRRGSPNPRYLPSAGEGFSNLVTHSIHRVAEPRERLMEEEASAERPFIAALANSKARGGLPAPGFHCAPRQPERFTLNPLQQMPLALAASAQAAPLGPTSIRAANVVTVQGWPNC